MADEKFEAMVERARQVVITSMTELTSVGELARIMAQFAAGEVTAAIADADMPWCERCQCYHHNTADHIGKVDEYEAKRRRLHEAMAAIKEYLDHTDE